MPFVTLDVALELIRNLREPLVTLAQRDPALASCDRILGLLRGLTH